MRSTEALTPTSFRTPETGKPSEMYAMIKLRKNESFVLSFSHGMCLS